MCGHPHSGLLETSDKLMFVQLHGVQTGSELTLIHVTAVHLYACWGLHKAEQTEKLWLSNQTKSPDEQKGSAAEQTGLSFSAAR